MQNTYCQIILCMRERREREDRKYTHLLELTPQKRKCYFQCKGELNGLFVPAWNLQAVENCLAIFTNDLFVFRPLHSWNYYLEQCSSFYFVARDKSLIRNVPPTGSRDKYAWNSRISSISMEVDNLHARSGADCLWTCNSERWPWRPV